MWCCEKSFRGKWWTLAMRICSGLLGGERRWERFCALSLANPPFVLVKAFPTYYLCVNWTSLVFPANELLRKKYTVFAADTHLVGTLGQFLWKSAWSPSVVTLCIFLSELVGRESTGSDLLFCLFFFVIHFSLSLWVFNVLRQKIFFWWDHEIGVLQKILFSLLGKSTTSLFYLSIRIKKELPLGQRVFQHHIFEDIPVSQRTPLFVFLWS